MALSCACHGQRQNPHTAVLNLEMRLAMAPTCQDPHVAHHHDCQRCNCHGNGHVHEECLINCVEMFSEKAMAQTTRPATGSMYQLAGNIAR